MKLHLVLRCAPVLAAFIASSTFCAETPEQVAASTPASRNDRQVFEGPFEPDLSRTSCVPVYPPAAVRAGAVGTTVVEMVIDASARIQRITVVKSAGDTRVHKLLDRAVVENLATCPFKRASKVAVPDRQTVTVKYEWRLE
jgi:protein TonB